MKSKTVKALRALAKQRGLKGYSKLSKEELLSRLQASASEADVAAATDAGTRTAPRAPAPTDDTVKRTAAETQAASPPDQTGYASAGPRWWEPAEAASGSARYASDEERVEGAKYALAPSGATVGAATTDLGEEIDRLPPIREPALCLLPQKPGILHAYWVLPERGRIARDLKLRLCRSEQGRLEVWQEVALPADSGTWYFHIPDSLSDQDVELQLGYYRDGQFVSAIPRGVARVPSLYASSTTDRRWWIAEDDFRRQYLRAGGFEAGDRGYGWTASIGSPGAPPPGPGAGRLGWPGGVSSR